MSTLYQRPHRLTLPLCVGFAGRVAVWKMALPVAPGAVMVAVGEGKVPPGALDQSCVRSRESRGAGPRAYPLQIRCPRATASQLPWTLPFQLRNISCETLYVALEYRAARV